MIKSEILAEKYRVQNELSQKYPTVKAYSDRAHFVTQEVSKKYGFSVNYVKLPHNKINLAALRRNRMSS